MTKTFYKVTYSAPGMISTGSKIFDNKQDAVAYYEKTNYSDKPVRVVAKNDFEIMEYQSLIDDCKCEENERSL